MEKDKSRGIKHVKDKKKYKGNSVKNAKYVPSKSKPNLGSNWDRYDSGEENEHEHKLSSSTDFSLLSNVPISTGSHFQFKDDKIEEEHSSEKVDLFCLDLDLLHKSMLSIPFHERLGIEKKYFKEFEIKIMDMEAQQHLSTYNEFIQSQHIQETTIPESRTENILSGALQDNRKDISPDEEIDILELVESCSIHDSNKVSTESKIKVGDNSEQDLEQWLDDILED